MAAWAAMSLGARAASVAAGAAVLMVAGYLGWVQTRPAPVEPVAEVAVAAPEVAAVPEVAAEVVVPEVVVAPEVVVPEAADVAVAPEVEAPAVVATEVAEPEAVAPVVDAAVMPQLAVPEFDVVRVAPDGSATVAGQALPGAAVSLRVDGVEVANVMADGNGKFAALFTLAASDAPRLMSMVMIDPAGAEVVAPAVVALAPIAAQVAAPIAAQVAAPVEAADSGDVAPEVEQAPAAILLTEEGAAVLQPGADVPAGVEANVGIETIAYTPGGAVQLAGRGQAGSYLRLYLDAAEISTLQIGADGLWAVTLGDVAPGIYTLRADQLDAAGKVQSRFETPFKRETLEALAAASGGAGIVAAPVVAAPVVVAPEVIANADQEVVADPVIAVQPVAVVEPEGAAPEVVGPEVVGPEVVAPEVVAEVVPEVKVPETVVPEVVAPEVVVPEVVVPEVVVVEPAPEVAVASPVVAAVRAPVSVTVQPGFTLWRIAREQFGDGVMYVQVFEANKDKIRNPDLIYPGQVFAIPAAGPKSE